MIYYFSGTGNSLYVAKELARLTDDNMLEDMAVADASAQRIDSDVIGFVFPVYAWGLPLVVKHFISKLPTALPKDCFVYAILTCGDDMAYTDRILQKCLEDRNWHLTTCYSLQMRNTYVCLPGFDTDSEDVVTKKNKIVHERLPLIAEKILRKDASPDQDLQRGSMPWLKSYILRPAFNRWLISDKRFRVTDACIHCGLCVRQCPLHNISSDSQQNPQWNGHCTHCLRCFHICPKHAINYGKFTRKKRQVKIIS